MCQPIGLSGWEQRGLPFIQNKKVLVSVLGTLKQLKQHAPAVGLVLLFAGLAVRSSLFVPIFETPDEVWHYAYIKNIADGNGLPIQSLDLAQPWRQEGGQPPVFYILGALATFWIDTNDFPQVNRPNPFSKGIFPDALVNNDNLYLHGPLENFPYHGAALAVHLARLLSVALGTLSVALTYIVALEVFPRRRDIATGALALHALNPQFIYISGSASNDATITLFAALTVWLGIRWASRGQSFKGILALGFSLGLALLSKLTAIALLPWLILIALVVARDRLLRGAV